MVQGQVETMRNIGIFGERSRKSAAQEAKLQEELGRIIEHIARVQDGLGKWEIERTRTARRLALREPGVFVSEGQLSECLQNIADTKARIEAYKEEKIKTERAIAELQPTAAQIEARRALQKEFSQVAEKRLKKTRTVQEILQQLRVALQDRIELAKKMRTAAEGLECQLSGDALDESRFEDLLNSLPDDLLGASERAHAALSEL